jgi:hypothetical protein
MCCMSKFRWPMKTALHPQQLTVQPAALHYSLAGRVRDRADLFALSPSTKYRKDRNLRERGTSA